MVNIELHGGPGLVDSIKDSFELAPVRGGLGEPGDAALMKRAAIVPGWIIVRGSSAASVAELVRTVRAYLHLEQLALALHADRHGINA